MGKTKIEWTEHSWNPITGCTKISPGCKNCYAERMARRLAGRAGYPAAPDHFRVTLRPDRLEQPLHRKKPTMYFIPSMGDLFHEDVPFEFITRVFDVMCDARSQQHVFQVLTKRPKRFNSWLNWVGEYWPGDSPFSIDWEVLGHAANVWLGVSVENPDYLWRVEELMKCSALVRFVSLEPLLGAVDLEDHLPYDICAICGWEGHTEPDRCPDCDSECCMGYAPGLDWVIVGGESGPGARPMHPDWVRGIVQQCRAASVPVFVKQLGSVWAKHEKPEGISVKQRGDTKGHNMQYWPKDLRIREFPRM